MRRLLLPLFFASLPALVAAEMTGYLVDGSGAPVRSGSGTCIRSGSWSAQLPGAGCDATPDRIVLLPGADGSTGAVVIRGAAGEKVLDKAYAGLEVSTTSMAERTEDATSVNQRYGSTLGAQPPRPVAYVVNFASGSASQLTPESKPVIEQMKTTLNGRPAPEITVIGHTDRVGKVEANDALSLKRAQAVRDILVDAGIPGARMEVAGRGEREPVVPTEDEVAEPRNRRVEISIR